jgi:organic radical activating enzyme
MKTGKEVKLEDIMYDVCKIREETGISKICLTGGDPLARPSASVHKLLTTLFEYDFLTSVETSGTIPWRKFTYIDGTSFVLDYKLKSAGIENGTRLFQDKNQLDSLYSTDFIKFVVYDEEDLNEMLKVIPELYDKCKATLAAGVYWNGKFRFGELYEALKKNKMLGKVVLNFQAHKAIRVCDSLEGLPLFEHEDI